MLLVFRLEVIVLLAYRYTMNVTQNWFHLPKVIFYKKKKNCYQFFQTQFPLLLHFPIMSGTHFRVNPDSETCTLSML